MLAGTILALGSARKLCSSNNLTEYSIQLQHITKGAPCQIPRGTMLTWTGRRQVRSILQEYQAISGKEIRDSPDASLILMSYISIEAISKTSALERRVSARVTHCAIFLTDETPLAQHTTARRARHH